MTKIIKLALVFCLIAIALPVSAEEDLGVGEQRILPGNPFYLLKQARRRIQEVFTFNPVKKLELKARFASERLAEIEKLVEKNSKKEILEKAVEGYEKQQEEIKGQAGKLKKKVKDNPKLKSFSEKYEHQVTTHMRVLEKLEGQVPEGVSEKIGDQKEKHLKRFQDVMLELEEEKDIPGRMESFLNNLPDKAKSIKNTTETLERTKERVRSEEAKEKLERVQNKIREKIQDRLNQNEGTDKDENGDRPCIPVISYCLDPKTGECRIYPDSCVTPDPCKQCEIEGEEKGQNKPDQGCEKLWWFDNETEECQTKEFCGLYMYEDLRTFETKEKCREALGAGTSAGKTPGESGNGNR